MKKYFIIRQDGSSIFKLPYQEEFIFHCLIILLDRTDEPLRLLRFVEAPELSAVQAESAIAAVERITEMDKNVLLDIRKYILK